MPRVWIEERRVTEVGDRVNGFTVIALRKPFYRKYESVCDHFSTRRLMVGWRRFVLIDTDENN